MFFRTLVPEKHLSSDTQDIVKLGIALIATMATLVLGLLVASAKSTYDTRRTQLLQVSADIILLDRVLANYGPETQDARVMLQRSVAAVLEQFWPANRARLVTIDRSASSVESVYDNIQRLAPQRCPAFAAGSGVDHRLRPGAYARAPFRTVGQLDPCSLPRGAGLLACRHLRQLWALRPSKRDCRRRLLRLCTVVFRCNLSDPGARPLSTGCSRFPALRCAQPLLSSGSRRTEDE